ncbi:MAG: MFS transporter [Candidatus Hodarchaeales archaeon]
MEKQQLVILLNAWFQKRIEIADMNPESQPLAINYFWLFSTQVAQFQIISTFIVLFLLDILTYAELGLLLAIQFGLIALLDYPTGALADAIGHRTVLALAYVIYGIAILFLLAADSFYGLLPWVILNAFGASQESGALQSWFDNNYRVTSGEYDGDRRIFGAFMGKLQIIFNIISATMFILGGVIAGVYSRRMLFIIQLFLVLIALTLIIRLMKNVEGVDLPQRTFQVYIDRLTGGVKFLISSRGILFLFLGLALFGAIGAIWGIFMLFPFYESYSGTDEYTGLLRAIIFASGIIKMIFIARLSKKIKKLHFPLFLSYLMLDCVFFALLFGFYEVFPPQNRFILSLYVGVIILFQWVGIWLPFMIIFESRLMIELVPDEFRNAVYSLRPTLTLLLGIPLITLGGFVITSFSFSAGILLLILLSLMSSTFLGLGLYWLANSKPLVQFKDEVEPSAQAAPT